LKPEGDLAVGRPAHSWEDNIRISFNEMGRQASSGSDQGPVVDSCGHSDELSGSLKDKKFLDKLLKKYSVPC
jgi:hypothetical protein